MAVFNWEKYKTLDNLIFLTILHTRDKQRGHNMTENKSIVLNKQKNETEQLFKVIVDSVFKDDVDNKSDSLDYKIIAKTSKKLRASSVFSASAHNKIETLFSDIDNKSELWHKDGNNYSHDMLALISSLNNAYQERKLLHAVWSRLPNGTYVLALEQLFFNKLATLNDMSLCFEYGMPLNRSMVPRFMDKVEEVVNNGGFKENCLYIRLGMLAFSMIRTNDVDEKQFFVKNAFEMCDKYFPNDKKTIENCSKLALQPKGETLQPKTR